MINHRFEELTKIQQAIAKARFINACAGDEYLYKNDNGVCKDPEGHVFCRQKIGKKDTDQNVVEVEITDECFDEQFKPIKNPYEVGAGWDGCLFETYGKGFDFVIAQSRNEIWTLLDSEISDDIILKSGYHYINAINYLITRIAVPESYRYTVNCYA